MKYTALSVVAIASFANAASSIDKDTIERGLKQLDHTKLLRNARELRNNYGNGNYGNNNNYYANRNQGQNQYMSQSQYQYNQYQSQKYQNNQNNGNNRQYEFQVDGSFSVQFETCASLTILDDNVMQDAANGYVYQTAKDYVVFKATNHMQVEKTFAVDIPTFVNTLSETILAENYNYCELCIEAVDVCLYNSGGSSYQYQQQQGGNQYGYQMANGGNRRLGDFDSEPIDCDTCKKVCGEQMTAYNYNSQYTDESAMGWLQTISQCQQLSYDDGYNLGNLQYGNYLNQNNGNDDAANANYNNYYNGGNVNYQYNNNGNYQQNQNQQQQYGEIYAGLMCNSDGTGIEIGLFKDNACTIWDPSDSFKDTLVSGTEPYIYHTKTKNLVEYVMQSAISCKDTQYYNPYDGDNQNYNNNNNNYNGYNVPDANEGCQDLFSGGYTMDLSAGCGSYGQNNGNYNYGQAQADGSEYGEYTYYGSNGKQTYSYDITDGDDQFQICSSLAQQVEQGTTHTTSTQSGDDNLYDFQKNQSITKRVRNHMSGDDIFLIIVGVLFGVAAIVFVYNSFLIRQCANRDKKKALISAGELS